MWARITAALFRRSEPEEKAFFTWNHPRLGRQQWSSRDFVLERRKFDSALRVMRSQQDSRKFEEDEQIGRLLVLDALAQDAGVEVSDGDIKKMLSEGGMIEPGQWVCCIDVKAGRVIVRQVDKPPDLGDIDTMRFT